MIGKYSVFNMLKVYNQNRELINAHIQGKKSEGLKQSTITVDGSPVLMGLSVAAFMFILLLGIILYIIAVYLSIKHWDELSTIARILVVLALLGVLGGPLISIIIVYIAKGNKQLKSRYMLRYR